MNKPIAYPENSMSLHPYGDEKINCSGCGACEQICPRRSIVMKADPEGFQYPIVDQESCNECGLCQRICPIANNWKNRLIFDQPDVYAARHKTENTRSRCASGGTFPALAHEILRQGGIVFGAAFDDNFQLRHIDVKTETKLYSLLGSKYVQSIIGDTYQKAKQALKNGKQVLFTGTPCQIAGLNSFLQRDYENLISCDLFCHGVPSPKVFQKYMESLEQRHHAKIIQYKFRSKIYGWRSYGIQITFSTGEVLNKTNQQDPYTLGFLENLYLRPICSICPFTTLHRPGDITIGDFWGIEKYMPELDDNKGISAILVNTPKGRRLFEDIQNEMLTRPSDVSQVLQQSLVSPSIPSSQRAAFFTDLDRLPFSDVQRIYISGLLPTVRRRIIQLKHTFIHYLQSNSRRPKERAKAFG
jgi:coenzyme F420-reducing hydrogenase beta subunit